VRGIATSVVLLETDTTTRLASRILLKPGSARPPVFMAHGLGGCVMELARFAGQIRSPHSIYGIQARGIDGFDPPFDRIEDMAQFHLDAIREAQPQGPYLLLGYSLGGLVMLEVAQRLVQCRERIALAAMVDSYPHFRHLSSGQKVRLLAGRATRRVSALIRGCQDEPDSAPVDGSRRGLRAADHESVSLAGTSTAVVQRMRESAYLALKRYQPRLYPGEIKFIRAAIISVFPADPAAFWAKRIRRFEVETTAGDHLGMITTYSESLASLVSRYLDEVTSKL
jgi:thioesterase domain-containing protein